MGLGPLCLWSVGAVAGPGTELCCAIDPYPPLPPLRKTQEGGEEDMGEETGEEEWGKSHLGYKINEKFN